MYSLSKVIVLLSVAFSVTAVPSHLARDPHIHHHLAARVASPDPIADPIVVAAPLRRRQRSLNRRCVPRPDSESSSSSSSSSSSPTPKSTDPVSEASPSPTSKTSTSTTPTTSPTPDSSSSELSDSSSDYSGDGTFYSAGLGACGIVNKDTDMIAAASMLFFDAYPGYTSGNPNENPLCGKKVLATYGGKSITVAITDRCEGCAYGSLDFTPTAFGVLADLSVGRIQNMKWHFV